MNAQDSAAENLSAADLLAQFLASDGDHSAEAFEALCQEFPVQAEEMRELYAEQMHLQKMIDAIGGGALGLDSRLPIGPQLQRGERVGSFTLDRVLGRGAMGEVWKANESKTGRAVAIKVMHSSLAFDPRSVLRFRREIDAVRRLSHPNLVRGEAAGMVAGCPYMVQELVEGGRSIAHWLAALQDKLYLSRQYYRTVARIARQTAEGLQHAHEHGVVHRDIKPQNVLLGDDDSPRVVDFGLALVKDEFALSQTGDVAGTAAYMSPEQVRGAGSKADQRSDIFGLGAVLYEMLTLRRPFGGTGAFDTMRAILEDSPVPPRDIRREVPVDLERICMRALSKQAQKRFDSMAEFADALAAAEREIGMRPRTSIRAMVYEELAPMLSPLRSVGTWIRSVALSRRSRLGVELLVLFIVVFLSYRLRPVSESEASARQTVVPSNPSIDAPIDLSVNPVVENHLQKPDLEPAVREPENETGLPPTKAEDSVELIKTLDWAKTIEALPDPRVVSSEFQEQIVKSGLPWKVRMNITGIEMLLVPPGRFTQGSNRDYGSMQYLQESPAFDVELTKFFYLGRFEVTCEEWNSLCPDMRSSGLARAPVAGRNTDQIAVFLARSDGCRLPTEAEWEFACRAGTIGELYGELDRIAWYRGNSGKETHPVGALEANQLGFHDMIGNVWEFCSDLGSRRIYAIHSRAGSVVVDPVGVTREQLILDEEPIDAPGWVMRGSCYYRAATHCRATIRGAQYFVDTQGYSTRGFRVARDP